MADAREQSIHTIRYIRENPIKLGRPAQDWGFVSEYDGWPPHEGHDPNSPYAKGKSQNYFILCIINALGSVSDKTTACNTSK